MSKHTPGPWRATQRTVTAPETEDRLGMEVKVYGGNSNDNRANCRLIAAAPDLLEALQELFGADMEQVLMGDGKDDQIAAIAKARAAIAKATGDAQ